MARSVPPRSRGRFTLFRDFVVLASGHVVSRLVGFFVFAFLARVLQPSAYGTVEYVVGLAALFATIIESGLGVVGVRRIAQEPASLPALASQIPLARLAVTIVLVPLMVLAATPATPGAGERTLVWLFALSLFAAPWRHEWLLQATSRMREAALAHLVRMGTFALVIVALVRAPSDVAAIGWAELVAVTATSLYFLGVQRAKITPLRFWVPMSAFLPLARAALVVGLGSSVWAAIQYVPLVLVKTLSDAVDTGWLAAASRVVGAMMGFSFLYHFNLYPAIARATADDPRALTAILTASSRVVAWASMLVALAVSMLAEPLLMVLFGERFGAAAAMLGILAWTLPLEVLSGHVRWALIAAGRQSQVLAAQVAGFVVLLAVGIPATHLFGARGAASSAVAAFLAIWVGAHWCFVRQGGQLPVATTTLVPAALAIAVAVTVHSLRLGSWWAACVVILVACAAPLLDRRLVTDLGRVGEARAGTSRSSEAKR